MAMGLPLACTKHADTPGRGWYSGAGGGCKKQPALFRYSTPVFQGKENNLFFSVNFF